MKDSSTGPPWEESKDVDVSSVGLAESPAQGAPRMKKHRNLRGGGRRGKNQLPRLDAQQ